MTTFNQASMVIVTTHFKASEQNHEENVKKAFVEVVNLVNDVKLIASDGEPLETNRFVLSVVSPGLQKLLSENTGESAVLHLPDCSSNSLKHLLSLFTEGISETGFSGVNDMNELIDTAKLLNVDLKNLSFSNQNGLQFENIKSNSKTETKLAENFLVSNHPMKKSDGKRIGRLSFESNPLRLKKPKIDTNTPLNFRTYKQDEPKNRFCKLNKNECNEYLESKHLHREKKHFIEKSNQSLKHPSEDSGFKSLAGNVACRSDTSNAVLPVKSLKLPLKLTAALPQSPRMHVKDRMYVICSKKDGKDSSFCNLHKKVHSGMKGDGNELKLTGKVKRKLLTTKESTNDWNCNVCDINFNTREKLRDHRREVKCKQRTVCRNKRRNVALPIHEDRSTIPFPEDLLTLPGNGNLFPNLEQHSSSLLSHVQDDNLFPSFEQNIYSHVSDISMEAASMFLKSNLELVQNNKQESLPDNDKFSSLIQNSLVSTNELFIEDSKEKQSKGDTHENPPSKVRVPRRLALTELFSLEIPLTTKEVMSTFEAKYNTSPVRKQLMIKCCPKNSTLRRCCLKLDKSPKLSG